MSPKEFNYKILQCNGENKLDMKNQIKLLLSFQSSPPTAEITCVKNEMAVVFCRIIFFLLKKIWWKYEKDCLIRLGVVCWIAQLMQPNLKRIPGEILGFQPRILNTKTAIFWFPLTDPLCLANLAWVGFIYTLWTSLSSTGSILEWLL